MSVAEIFCKDISTAPSDVIAILFGYNEEDIIISTILNALKQGLHVYYVDDNSTDNSRVLVQRFFEQTPEVGYRMMDSSYRANNDSHQSWHLKRQLQFKTYLAQTIFRQYKWLVHMDCDEVFQCPWAPTVAQGLRTLPDSVGKVNCDVYDYFPATVDAASWQYNPNSPMLDVTKVLTVYRKRSATNTYYRFLRISEALDLNCGHGGKTEPNTAHKDNIIMHHYPYRSKQLAQRKVQSDRLPRIATNDVQSGIGWHYRLLADMRLPIDVDAENKRVVIEDGRYCTYYLKRKSE